MATPLQQPGRPARPAKPAQSPPPQSGGPTAGGRMRSADGRMGTGPGWSMAMGAWTRLRGLAGPAAERSTPPSTPLSLSPIPLTLPCFSVGPRPLPPASFDPSPPLASYTCASSLTSPLSRCMATAPLPLRYLSPPSDRAEKLRFLSTLTCPSPACPTPAPITPSLR